MSSSGHSYERRVSPIRLYVGIDCGGTKSAAAICDDTGVLRGRGFGGPANYTDVGLAAFLQSVGDAVDAALANAESWIRKREAEVRLDCERRGLSIPVKLARRCQRTAMRSASRTGNSGSAKSSAGPAATGGESTAAVTAAPSSAPSAAAAATPPNSNQVPISSLYPFPLPPSACGGFAPPFEAAWLGIAGVDSPADVAALSPHIGALLCLPYPSTRLVVANDTSLLASPVTSSQHPDVRSGVVAIAGTGSIVMSFKQRESGLLRTLGRVGGFGWLLGDEGSGYAVGRDAIRKVLEQADTERLMGDEDMGSIGGACGLEKESTFRTPRTVQASEDEAHEHMLRDRILKHWGLSSTDDLLNAVYSHDTPASFPAIGPSAAPSEAPSSPQSRPAESPPGSRPGSSGGEEEQEEQGSLMGDSQFTLRDRPPALFRNGHGNSNGRHQLTEVTNAAESEAEQYADLAAGPTSSASLLPPAAATVLPPTPVSPIPSLDDSPPASPSTTSLPSASTSTTSWSNSSTSGKSGEASADATSEAFSRVAALSISERRESSTSSSARGAPCGGPCMSSHIAAARAIGERKHRLASLAPLVFHLAFAHAEPICLGIVHRQAAALAEQILQLLSPPPSSAAHIDAETSVLCAGGSLLGVARYRAVLAQELEKRGVKFQRIEYVGDPARSGAAAISAVWEHVCIARQVAAGWTL